MKSDLTQICGGDQQGSLQMCKDIQLSAAMFQSVTDQVPKDFSGSLQELLGTRHRVTNHKDGAAFSPVTYEQGGRRGNSSVRQMNAIVFDFDHLSRNAFRDVGNNLKGRCNAVYTTFSHKLKGEDDLSFRVILPVSRPMSAYEFSKVHNLVSGELGGFHDSCTDVARLYFLPGCPSERLNFSVIRYNDGFVIDVDSYLLKPVQTPLVSVERRQANKKDNGKAPAAGLQKVFRECEAFERISKYLEMGNVLGHADGFALFHLCLNIEGGVDWFKENVHGWGKTDSDQRQLEQSEKKEYAPWSCRKMQDCKLCHFEAGTNPCLPERTPGVSRSPFSFAFGKTSLRRVERLMDELRKETKE